MFKQLSNGLHIYIIDMYLALDSCHTFLILEKNCLFPSESILVDHLFSSG